MEAHGYDYSQYISSRIIDLIITPLSSIQSSIYYSCFASYKSGVPREENANLKKLR